MCDTPEASNSHKEGDPKATSYRNVLEGTGLTPDAAASALAAPSRTAISLTVNGVRHRIDVEDRWTLVELLRDQLELTGTKSGCDRSECGACTVLLNGQPVYACSQLAVWADGADVQTVEGLAQNGRLTPLQQAFIDHNAPQCGFCTPGQLMTATALLNTVPRPDEAQVKQALVGNLCRCSNYNAIVEAVVAAGAQQGGTA
jgi:aerobic-type carbon monoxide dehydrogenase small subunit (CoxS/CutS family)